MKYKILVVTANYYRDISNKLNLNTKAILNKKTTFKFIYVPGVFEIPVVIAKNIKNMMVLLLWDV